MPCHTVLLRIVALSCASISALTGIGFAQPRGPRQSGPIALSDNGVFLANGNPDANTVTVFVSSPPTHLVKPGEIPVGREPCAIAIHPNYHTGYAANAYDGTVSVLHLQSRRVTHTIDVGAEPAAITLSPNGRRLYVADSASNDLRVFSTKSLLLLATVDLNPFGTAPRAIAVTDDGDHDDDDETIFVALFFAELRPGKTSVEEGQDDQREGRVVAISAATNAPLPAPNPIGLGPLASTGFNSNGRLAPAGPGPTPNVPSTNPQTFTTPTSCFPNQLARVALHPASSRAYVVSTGASPNGPFRFNSNTQGWCRFSTPWPGPRWSAVRPTLWSAAPRR